jgi:hypothetical protein
MQDPIIPLDRATLVEHVHQLLMYGRVLLARVVDYHGRVVEEDNREAGLVKLVSCSSPRGSACTTASELCDASIAACVCWRCVARGVRACDCGGRWTRARRW